MTLNLGQYLPQKEKDSTKLMIIGASLLITTVLFLTAAQFTIRVIRGLYQYHSKPRIELIAPPPPACKICHCGKTSCHRDCGEDNMCSLKCEGLCQKR